MTVLIISGCKRVTLLQASYFNDRRSSLVAGDRQLLKSSHQNFDRHIKIRSPSPLIRD
ncbi:hypothetical protein [Microcoleus sp.]|uniref:hypothetical protein n=1 Tax=Microcoleus sp. TaxID=44472 RepID=UPI00403EC416